MTQTNEGRIAAKAASISGLLADRFGQIEREQAARLEQQRAEKKKREQERIKLHKRERALIDERLPLARSGLERLLQLGKSDEFRTIAENYRALTNDPLSIGFYQVERPSGEAWDSQYPDREAVATRQVRFTLRPNELEIAYGAGDERNVDFWVIQYAPESDTRAVTADRHYTALMEDEEWSVEDMLWQLAHPYAQPMGLVEDPHQRSHEWEPQNVAFEVLVNCADKDQFEAYAIKCLSNLEAELRRLMR